MKLILVLLLCVMTTSIYGQIENGPITLTGTLEYNTTDVTAGSSQNGLDTFVAGVGAGKFIRENVMLGLNVNYSNSISSGSSANSASFEQNAFGFGPSIRKYHMYNETFGWFFDGGVNFIFAKNTISNGFDENERDVNSISLSLAPGFAFFPTKKIAIEFTLQGFRYQRDKTEGTVDVITKQTSININPRDFTVGASYFFGR